MSDIQQRLRNMTDSEKLERILFHAKSHVEHYQRFRDESLASMVQNAADDFMHALYKGMAERSDAICHAHSYPLVLVGELAECACNACCDVRQEKEATTEQQGIVT